MFRLKWQALSSLVLSLLLILGTAGLIGCDRVEPPSVTNVAPKAALVSTRQLSEVSPPRVIQELNSLLDQYQPQVKILSPQPGETLVSTTVEVKLSLQDLPTFQDPEFKLGPHLHLIVDNNPYLAIYDPSQPYMLKDLTPGTHTLRVFASRPWHESFKNEGAYAQVTFNVITPTGDNSPDPNLPVLTFSRPKGEFGAEPIMLDYYLTHAPLHWVAQEKGDDDILDWRIRVTVNGESFVLDRWQPIYLKGFQEGDNWIQLEFLDEKGDRVDNVFNNTVRLITYHPQGQDTLSKMTRGELTFEAVRQIVDPTYRPTKKTEEQAPQLESGMTQEPLPQARPDVTIPLEEAPEEPNELPSGAAAVGSPDSEAIAPSREPIEPAPIEPAPIELAPIEPEILEPVVESQPEVTSVPATELPASPESVSVESAIAKPKPVASPAPEAIAPPVDFAEPESAIETIPPALDQIFEQPTSPEAVVEANFPDTLANPPGDKPLSPGIRYFEEDGA